MRRKEEVKKNKEGRNERPEKKEHKKKGKKQKDGRILKVRKKFEGIKEGL